MKETIRLTCPICTARVPCEIKEDTGGVEIKANSDESIVVLTVNTAPMKRHTKEHHA